MLKLLIGYTSYDGHTAEIADRIATTLRDHDYAVEVCDLARSLPKRPLADYDGAIAGGPLHGGKHHPQLVKFASQHRQTLN